MIDIIFLKVSEFSDSGVLNNGNEFPEKNYI